MRRRLVLAIAGVAALAVAVLAVPLAVMLGRTYREQELLRLQRDAIAVTRGIDAGRGGDPVEIPRFDGEIAVYDRSGRRVAGSGPATADPVVASALADARPADVREGDRFVVAVALISGERVTGAVRADRSGAAAAADTRAALAVLALASVAILGIAMAAGWLLARRLAAPLERVSRTARRLGEGDFSARSSPVGVRELDDVVSALNRAATRLGELVGRERAFSADASHQLRTPLQALRIELETMQMGGRQDPALAAALAQVDRLERTTETLLAVARDQPRPSATTDAAAVLRDCAARWTGPLAASGRPLRLIGERAGVHAAAAPTVVGEILEVLVANAHRHGAGEVRLALAADDEWVTIDVSDDGPGLGPDPEAAFARRVSGDAGHGIGLALARALAHAEQGRLSSLGGAGATLRLQLLRARGRPA